MHCAESFFLWLANRLPRCGFADRQRWRLLRLAGLDFEGPCIIWGGVNLRPIGGAANVHIGRDSVINTGVRFGVPKDRVVIGSSVQVGPGVMFETVNHGLVHVPGRGRGARTAPITVEDEVWIGAGAIILSGVTAGYGAVVAAGAVVNHDVAPSTVVGGMPARLIRQIAKADAAAVEDGEGAALVS